MKYVHLITYIRGEIYSEDDSGESRNVRALRTFQTFTFGHKFR